MVKVQQFTTNIKGKKNSLIVRKSNNNIIFSMTDLSTIFSDCGVSIENNSRWKKKAQCREFFKKKSLNGMVPISHREEKRIVQMNF